MDSKQDKRRGITMGKAILKLNVFVENGMVTVHVLKARHLSSACSPEPCQSYVEVSLEPDVTNVSRCRTSTQPDRHPVFNEQFSFELMMPEDCKKRLYISVWNCYANSQCYDEANKHFQAQLEFMGCMSFGVNHILSEEKAIDGWYYLLKDGIGRRKHLQAILNSVIYSEAGEIRPLAGQKVNDAQALGGYEKQEQLYSNINGFREPVYTPYENVTHNCQQIIKDITSHSRQTLASENHVTYSSSPEEDTYTTFVFTKSPVRKNNQNSNGLQKSFGKNGDLNVKIHQQGAREHQEESIYVKMYPPKAWRQNGYVQSSTDNKPIKQVGFTDLVNSENIRGLPESRRFKDRSIYSPDGVDISELDTQGYMSLSQVRREEETIYASIEPLNGSYLNDNASEISEFTYSKNLSRASQALYPNITPLSSRKLLKIQQQMMLQSRANDVQRNGPVNQEHDKHQDEFKIGPQTKNLSPKSEQLWCDYNNIHNDSGIADHDSSPMSDCEGSDHTIHFAYKPKQDMQTLKAPIPQSTPIPQRKVPEALKLERNLTGTPKLQTHAQDVVVTRNSIGTPIMQRNAPGTPTAQRQQTQANQPAKIADIQVHDIPRWAREKSGIVCTNDSCVEDNDTMAHTPSCPYHVCTNCNGIVPQFPSCADQSCSRLHPHSRNNNVQPMYKTQIPYSGRLPLVKEALSEEGYSEGGCSEECGSSEDDFGYMSMEKFNIYKDTVLKHHKGAVECQDHETKTKIYFL